MVELWPSKPNMTVRFCLFANIIIVLINLNLNGFVAQMVRVGAS